MQNDNVAYIDGANLHKGILELGWKLDYKRFGVYLKDKYKIEKAYLFLGFIAKNTQLYQNLQDWGYTLVFKPTVPGTDGEIKGNCDAELVLQAAKDFYEHAYNKALLISGDGDFACLVKFLSSKNKLDAVLAPQSKKCSILIKQVAPKIVFLEELRKKLEYKP